MSLLCDIGNSFAHFYDGKRVWRESHENLSHYQDQKVCYINVSQRLKATLKHFQNWIDLEPFIEVKTEYRGLGIDRKALILAIEDGVVVDAGSAITVDKVSHGKHLGGFIYPGIQAMQEAYEQISPVLMGFEVFDLQSLPQNTSQALFYGTIKPLILAIEELGNPLYITGGDGKFLSQFLPRAIYKEKLIFQGLEKVKDRVC